MQTLQKHTLLRRRVETGSSLRSEGRIYADPSEVGVEYMQTLLEDTLLRRRLETGSSLRSAGRIYADPSETHPAQEAAGDLEEPQKHTPIKSDPANLMCLAGGCRCNTEGGQNLTEILSN